MPDKVEALHPVGELELCGMEASTGVRVGRKEGLSCLHLLESGV